MELGKNSPGNKYDRAKGKVLWSEREGQRYHGM